MLPLDEGSQSGIMVHPIGNIRLARRYELDEVQIAVVGGSLKTRVDEQLKSIAEADELPNLVTMIDHWIDTHQLPTTLSLKA